MKTNEAGLCLIKASEGLRLVAYQDRAGVWTIGYGHTAGVYPSMVITAAQAEIFFPEDVASAERQVSHYVTVPLNEYQFSALVSFVFNMGIGRLMSSTILRKLNRGDYAGAAAEFPRWDKAHTPDGRVIEDAGLKTRRAAEQALFLYPSSAQAVA